MPLIEVHTDEFRATLSRWEASVHMMVNTLANVAKLTDKKAIDNEYVPYFTGDLEKSFTYLVADGNQEMQVAMTYSSIADDGYDYALAQHENYYRHPIQGHEQYLELALYELREKVYSDERWVLLDTDYMSLFER